MEAKKRIVEWTLANFPHLRPELKRLWMLCRDYHLGDGIQRANWEATFRKWIAKEDEIRGNRRPSYREREYPQDRTSPRSSAPVALANVIPLVRAR